MLIFSWLYAAFGEKGRPCIYILCVLYVCLLRVEMKSHCWEADTEARAKM